MSVLAIRLREGDAWIDTRLKELAAKRNLEKSTLARELLIEALAVCHGDSHGTAPANAAANVELASRFGALAADLASERAADRILALQTYRMALRAAVLAGAAAVSTEFVANEDQKTRLDELIADSERLFAEAEAKLLALMQAAKGSSERARRSPEAPVPTALDADSTA